MTLDKLKKNEKAIVKKITCNNKNIRQRILDMGITEGTIVIVKKISPLGDPICIFLRDYEICLRKKELKTIEVILLK